MNREELIRSAQEQALEMPATPETLSPEKVQELATSKESALTDLVMRSAKETKEVEAGFAQSAQDLGSTPEDIAPITAKLEALESEKERVIEDARGEIHAEAAIEVSRRNAKYPEEILDGAIDKSIAPSSLEQDIEPTSGLRERSTTNPDDLSARQFSKENMSGDRSRLAAEIRQERAEAREKIASHKMQIEELSKKVEQSDHEIESAMQDLERLLQERSDRANSLAGRFKSFLHIETAKDKQIDAHTAEKNSFIESSTAEKQEAEKELQESMNMLIDADATLKGVRSKISEHYQGAEKLAKQPSLQNIARESNAFFVHMIMSDSELGEDTFDRGNALTNKNRIEDSVDLVLSLEPSISTSSVVPGKDERGNVSGMWGGGSGLLIAGGRISAAGEGDLASVAKGLKERSVESGREAVQTREEIERIASTRSGSSKWNEFIVNAPEACGYFTSIRDVDANGTVWISGKDGSAKTGAAFAEQLRQENPEAAQKVLDDMRAKVVAPFVEQMNIAQERGLPFYVMTPDRRFLEVKNINENGSLEVGEELTPEQAASGRAGLSSEKRKEIGSKLLEKGVFRGEEARTEAQEIIGNM